MTRFLMILFCFFSFTAYAEDIRDSATGETFPREISFQHNGNDYHLHCTGVATRKKFFVKVYSVANYLQDGATSTSADAFQHMLEDDNAKQLTLKFVRDVGADKIVEGYQDSFKRSFRKQPIRK